MEGHPMATYCVVTVSGAGTSFPKVSFDDATTPNARSRAIGRARDVPADGVDVNVRRYTTDNDFDVVWSS